MDHHRSLLVATDATAPIPLQGFLKQLAAELDRRFGWKIVDHTVGIWEEDIPDVEFLEKKDVRLSGSDHGSTVSPRTLHLAFFGFCLTAFEDTSIDEVAKMVPSIGEIGSVQTLVEHFIRIIGQRANVAINAKGTWRTEPEIVAEATKMLPEFFHALSRAGVDEMRLATMPEQGDADDDESLYQPSFSTEGAYIIWNERWGRLAYDARFLSAMGEALARVPQQMALSATTLMMRLVAQRENVTLQAFKAIIAVVAKEYSDGAFTVQRGAIN